MKVKEERKEGKKEGRKGGRKEGREAEEGRVQRRIRDGERRESEGNGRIFHIPRSHIIFVIFSFYISSLQVQFFNWACVYVDGCVYEGVLERMWEGIPLIRYK